MTLTRHWRSLVTFIRRRRTLGEEVLMYVARLVSAHPTVLVEPVLVGLELAQVHGVPDKCRFHQAINIGFHRHGRPRVYL